MKETMFWRRYQWRDGGGGRDLERRTTATVNKRGAGEICDEKMVER